MSQYIVISGSEGLEITPGRTFKLFLFKDWPVLQNDIWLNEAWLLRGKTVKTVSSRSARIGAENRSPTSVSWLIEHCILCSCRSGTFHMKLPELLSDGMLAEHRTCGEWVPQAAENRPRIWNREKKSSLLRPLQVRSPIRIKPWKG